MYLHIYECMILCIYVYMHMRIHDVLIFLYMNICAYRKKSIFWGIYTEIGLRGPRPSPISVLVLYAYRLPTTYSDSVRLSTYLDYSVCLSASHDIFRLCTPIDIPRHILMVSATLANPGWPAGSVHTWTYLHKATADGFWFKNIHIYIHELHYMFRKKEREVDT